MNKVWPSVARFLRRQQLFAATAVAVYAIFWAVGLSADPMTVVVYSFCLGNLIIFAVDRLRFLYDERQFPQNWLIFLALLAVLVPPIFFVSTVVLRLVTPSAFPRGLRVYVATGWKFPTLAAALVAIIYDVYRHTQQRLERRNRSLQQAMEMQAAERELQEQELQRAREIQQALLPREIPQVAGFRVAGTWEPARVVGGDYFDVIRLSDTKLGICIADVVGKSVSAALLMANVQATVRAFASESASPAWLCSRVNEVLCNNTAPDKFVTLFYGVLDARERALLYTNAGHLRPLLLRGSGATEPLADGGAVLGVFREWPYEAAVQPLAPGDRLLLFTDGITEADRPGGEEFGEERLIEAARAAVHMSPNDMNAHLLARVKEFCDSRMRDDATLIVIEAVQAQGQTAR